MFCYDSLETAAKLQTRNIHFLLIRYASTPREKIRKESTLEQRDENTKD